MFPRYLKHTFWFCCLSFVISWCLCHMCFLGFYVKPSLQGNEGLIAGIVAGLTAALWLFSYSNRTKLAGIIVLAAAAAVALAAVYASGSIALAVQDTEENPYSFFVIAAVVIIGVWLLASTKRGLIVLLVLGIFISALVAFLYKNNSLVWMGGFLAGCIVYYALRYYYGSVLSSQTVKTSFFSLFVVALVMAAVAGAAGGAVYSGVVKAANPPSRDLKLYDKEKSMSLMGFLGLVQTVTLLDPSLTTDGADDQQEESTGEGIESSDKEQDNSENEEDLDASGGVDAWDPLKNNDNETSAISYDLPELILEDFPLIPLIIILAAAAVTLKLLSRRWWLSGVMKKPKEERISKMYHLWLKKYRQIKLGKNIEETPFEYALRQKDHLADFATGNTDMMKLTEVFVETSYGARAATEEEWEMYLGFYKKFYRRVFKYLGPLRFIIKFFIL